MQESISQLAASVSDLFRSRFPSDVAVVVREITGHYPLFPEEEQHVAKAVASRRAEFSTGRWCAREALQAAGGAACAIPMGKLRAPCWPDGFAGSITHAAGLAAAVATPNTLYSGIGIDLCDIAATTGVLATASRWISGDHEVLAAQSSAQPGVDARVLLFSAKESAVKVLSPGMDRFLEFTEVQITFDGDRFVADLAGQTHGIHGWWQSHRGLLLTGAWLHP